MILWCVSCVIYVTGKRKLRAVERPKTPCPRIRIDFGGDSMVKRGAVAGNTAPLLAVVLIPASLSTWLGVWMVD